MSNIYYHKEKGTVVHLMARNDNYVKLRYTGSGSGIKKITVKYFEKYYAKV